jgi:hypothetical protein
MVTASEVDPVLAYLLDDLVALAPFGLAAEVTLAAGGLLVTGTPIADEEYFRRIGEHFQQVTEGASGRLWNRSREAEREWRHGWDEDQLAVLGRDRARGFERHGEDVQSRTRQRVMERPSRVPYYDPAGEAGDALRARFAALFGDGTEPSRTHVHLRDVRITEAGADPVRRPLWRVALRHVSGWALAEAIGAEAEPEGSARAPS